MSKKAYTLSEIAKLTDCTFEGEGSYSITGVSDLGSATSDEAVFVANAQYAARVESSKAGAVFIRPNDPRIAGRHYLVTENPEAAFRKLAALFVAERDLRSGFTGIHPTAVVHPSAQIGANVSIGPHAVVDREVRVGANTQIGPGCYLGVQVTIGDDCVLYSRVTVSSGSCVGNRVILQPGVVIGSPGYGYRQDREGRHHRIDHIGNVVIEDDVEIGANSTIDQAQLGSTRIGRGTKIDNLVQIAHNVQIGQDNLIISQSGIAGSSSTGRGVILAGQVGVTDHVHLADRVILAARSGVSKSIEQAGTYSGAPAIPVLEHNRRHARLRQLETLFQRVKALEKQSV